jgi:hypothetical protein
VPTADRTRSIAAATDVKKGMRFMQTCFRGRGRTGSVGRRGAQTPVMVHSLLVLEFGVHITAVEPTVVLPLPSRAVPVPRLMIW